VLLLGFHDQLWTFFQPAETPRQITAKTQAGCTYDYDGYRKRLSTVVRIAERRDSPND
jgi:hypothetical protein